MSKWLKQSTAASLIVGPFLSVSDGYSSKESFTALSGVMYKANGASTSITPVAASHTASGMYHVDLASGSTDTVGILQFHFANSACHLPVWENFLVLTASAYDSLVSGTDLLGVELAASGITASKFATGAIHAAAISASTITASTLASNSIHAAAIAASTFTASKFGAGAIESSTLAASTFTASKFAANSIESAAFATGAISVGKLGASAIGASNLSACAVGEQEISACGANKIADHTIRRGWGQAASSSYGDAISFRSLLGAIAKLVNKIDSSSGSLRVYREDDNTVLGTQSITACANASPIVTLDTV